jgi:hypothetical protein
MVLTSFYIILSLTPFIQGRYLAFTCTVNNSSKIAKSFKYICVGFIVNGFISLIISIVYFNGYGKAMTISIILRLLWIILTIYIIYQTYKSALLCFIKILTYHDFLINYKQTPRSKILRRHLPEMDAVVEEASIFE